MPRARNSEEVKARADAQFKRRDQIDRDREQARAEVAGKAQAVDEKTARLKAQRLAKEAVDAAAAEEQRPTVKPKGPAKPSGAARSRVR